MNMKKIIIVLIVLAVAGLGFYAVRSYRANKLYRNKALACGNGRIEATEINISARIAGKVEKITVLEGEKVQPNQILVVMQTNVLVANLAQAEAKKAQAIATETSALAKIALQQATLDRMKSDLEQIKAIEKNAEVRYNRYKKLMTQDATSTEQFETSEMEYLSNKARRASAEAAIKETEANVLVAKADAQAARANIQAAVAEINSIKADIDDSILKSPLLGRIQYRITEPGEVLSAGGRALNMIDLTDVYMTFFLPEQTVGKVQIGSDVRIVLDAVPDCPLPAKVTYVSSDAQFTPKTVETKVERQKLMFRVKAHIDRGLLEKYFDIVKTGLPGVAWVKLDARAPWPKELQVSEATRKRIEQHLNLFSDNAVPKISTVNQSNTVINSKTNEKKRQQLEKQFSGASREQILETGTKFIKKMQTDRQQEVEKSVDAAKKAALKKQTDVDKIVEKAKKDELKYRTAPVKGDNK